MIKTILWDIDGTLLDFTKSEQNGIRMCLEEIGFSDCTDELLSHYARINCVYWEALERGELSKQEVLVGRFERFFRETGIACPDIAGFNDSYEKKLGEYFFENEDSVQLCRKLSGRVRQYGVTNGTVPVQKSKLKGSGLGEVLEKVFISDEIGVDKPGLGFFEHVFSEIGPVDRKEVMIVGDSLTSDMKGGNNAGILCCWYNPQHKENTAGVSVDYEISHLWEIEKLLENGGEG